MGYACPVCEAPQRDGEHLANHLAFTAMLRGGAHEDWLDEHVPDWTETNPESLAERVSPLADEAAYEEVFEDTVEDAAPDRGHALFDADADADDGGLGNGGGGGPTPVEFEALREGEPTDEVAERILSQAEAFTEEMYGFTDDDGEGGTNRNGNGEGKTAAAESESELDDPNPDADEGKDR